MTRLTTAALVLLLAACGSPSRPAAPETAAGTEPAPETAAWPEADPSDVSSLDGLIDAYYEVVSGPAGEYRDWDRDKSLHIPGAMVVITRTGEDGGTEIGKMTISEYHDRNPGPAPNAFYEIEINRSVRRHGSTIHIWSTYEWSTEPGGAAGGRGVNSIEAIWDGTRYWITSWTYDGRTDAPPVPEEYMPGADASAS